MEPEGTSPTGPGGQPPPSPRRRPRLRRASARLRRLPAKVRTVSRLPLRDQLALFRILAMVALVEVAVHLVPLPRLSRWLGVPLGSGQTAAALSSGPRGPAAPPAAPDGGDPDDDAGTHPGAIPTLRLTPVERRQVAALRRVMRNWFLAPGPCLRESLVLGHVLRRRRPVLHIGVARKARGIGAHAWIVVEGVALGAQQGFRPLTVPRDASAAGNGRRGAGAAAAPADEGGGA